MLFCVELIILELKIVDPITNTKCRLKSVELMNGSRIFQP